MPAQDTADTFGLANSNGESTGYDTNIEHGGTFDRLAIYLQKEVTPAQEDEPVAWPHECEDLCKAAEEMQRAVNELWKAQNPKELEEGDKSMDMGEATELHGEAWNTLCSRIYEMRSRMRKPAYTRPNRVIEFKNVSNVPHP